jgi:hypothetical protein
MRRRCSPYTTQEIGSDERRHLVGHLPDRVDVRGRSDDILGEAAVARDADRIPVRALIARPALAEEARAAEERRVDGDAVSLTDARLDRLRAERDDLAGELRFLTDCAR